MCEAVGEFNAKAQRREGTKEGAYFGRVVAPCFHYAHIPVFSVPKQVYMTLLLRKVSLKAIKSADSLGKRPGEWENIGEVCFAKIDHKKAVEAGCNAAAVGQPRFKSI